MKATHPIRFLFQLATASAALIACAGSLSAAFVISETSEFFTPSFRGEETTTYFGWSAGTIGRAVTDEAGTVIGRELNGTPSINPGGLTGDLLTAEGTVSISSTNNIYSSASAVTAAGITLPFPPRGRWERTASPPSSSRAPASAASDSLSTPSPSATSTASPPPTCMG